MGSYIGHMENFTSITLQCSVSSRLFSHNMYWQAYCIHHSVSYIFFSSQLSGNVDHLSTSLVRSKYAHLSPTIILNEPIANTFQLFLTFFASHSKLNKPYCVLEMEETKQIITYCTYTFLFKTYKSDMADVEQYHSYK